MEYPFSREPEFSESNFSILQHDAIEEIMNLKLDDNREESFKKSSIWVEKSISYLHLYEERSSLEGLSRLYSFIASDLEVLEKYEEALPYSKKSIDSMAKCCAFNFSQLYTHELARLHFQHASLLELLNQNKECLLEAQKSLQILNYLVDQSDYEPNVNIEDDMSNVEEFINNLI